jgi:hypothetical protein
MLGCFIYFFCLTHTYPEFDIKKCAQEIPPPRSPHKSPSSLTLSGEGPKTVAEDETLGNVVRGEEAACVALRLGVEGQGTAGGGDDDGHDRANSTTSVDSLASANIAKELEAMQNSADLLRVSSGKHIRPPIYRVVRARGETECVQRPTMHSAVPNSTFINRIIFQTQVQI